MFGELFIKWKESLSFYRKDSFKLFLLASVNNLYKAIVIFIKKFWWMPLLTGFFIALFYSLLPLFSLIVDKTAGIFFFLFLFMPVLLISIFLFFVIGAMPYLLLRASHESKDFEYLKKYISKIIIFFSVFMFFILVIAFLLLFSFKNDLLFKENLLLIVSSSKYLFFSCIFGVVISFNIFLFLDSHQKFVSIFSSFAKAIKVFIYFLPVTMFFGLFSFITAIIRDFIAGYVKSFWASSFYIASIVFALIYLILYIVSYLLTISFIANYYTILRHKYYNFFYKEN
ncbi:hypothetical protein KJ644_04675 [Candidatus Dependentiae bacterium]|nr:hypothetical protein [Candidatus Dependentiae bacterium]